MKNKTTIAINGAKASRKKNLLIFQKIQRIKVKPVKKNTLELKFWNK